jgi:hypothetical protein
MKMGRSGRRDFRAALGTASVTTTAPEKENPVPSKSKNKANGRKASVRSTRKPKAPPRDVIPVFIVPCDTDIACGRGKGVTKRPGNQKYLSILQESRELYQAAKTIYEKSKIIELCRKRLAEETGRFITFDKMNQCYEISPKQAHQKIGQVSAGGKEECALFSTVAWR